MTDTGIPAYVSSVASPADRGHDFGRAHAGRVAATLRAYRWLFAAGPGLGSAQVQELGTRVASQLRQDWPDLAAEITGIAAGAGVSEPELFAVNARTEILAGAAPAECSVIGALPARSATGGLVLAQNWDWHPALAGSRVLWTVTQPDGRWFTTLTEAGILAKIGLNSAGLGVLLNILCCSRDGGVGGLPVHALLRLLLQSCDDFRAATGLIRHARTTASSCVTLGWQQGEQAELVSAELAPDGPRFLPPDNGVLLHTNHFLAGPSGGRDLYPEQWPDTLSRLAELCALLTQAPAVSLELISDALSSHTDGPFSVCCHGGQAARFTDQAVTLASVLLQPGSATMTVAPGNPCTMPYAAIAVPPGPARSSQSAGTAE
jgi:isopenicillin-N N-acyltransferase-like protein